MESAWKILAASVQGVSHQKENIPCQDAFAFSLVPEGAIIAVADGAGSASHSQLGAKCAVEKVVDNLISRIIDNGIISDTQWGAIIQDAFRVSREALIELSSQHQIDLISLATTLTCALLFNEQVILGHLGDGIVVVRSLTELDIRK